MTMTVNLGAPLEAFVEDVVAGGRYGSRSEVLREGVRLVQEREQRVQQLRKLVQPGLDDVDAGRTVSLNEAAAFARASIVKGVKRRT